MRGSCVIFSSNTDNGLNAGSFYLYANNDASSASGNIDSGDLLHKTRIAFPCLLTGKINYYTPLCVGRVTEDSGVITRQ